jgi:TadE-like protein
MPLRIGLQLHRRKERGQALVEASLTLVAFLVIFMGIIEIGQILFVHQTLVERTRNAVRWAVVTPWDDANSPTWITNMILFNSTTPADGAQPVFGLTAQNVTVSRPQPDYSAADRIVVTVTGYALTFMSNAVAQAAAGNVSPSQQFNGLTIQEGLPYEVSNGSSH